MNNSCTCGIYPDEQMRYWEVSCSCPQGQGGGVTSGEVETMIDAAVSGKQDTLVSGVSIKKLNGESILGPGNIVITGGGVDAYTKAETDALLETKASTADTASLQSQISDISSDLTNDFYDKTEVDTKLALKSNIADVYNKDAVDSMLATKASTATTNTISAAVDTKQATLVSGVNIKTLNGESILGSGNISITGGTVDAYTKAESDALLAEKQNVSDMSNYATTKTVSTKADITALTAVNGVLTAHTADNVVHTTQADKNTWNTVTDKADNTALTAVNQALTGHTSNSEIHVTQANKNAWDAKVDQSGLTAYTLTSTTDSLSGTVTAHTSDQTIHVTAADKTAWSAKLDPSALNGYATEQWVEDKGYLTAYTETDPVFTGSPAYSITNADKTNWDTVSTKADASALTAVNNALTSHTDNATIHVTATEKATWNSKQDAISDLATIRSNASNAVAQLNGYTLTSMTKAAFDALTAKDPNTIYFVKD